jgi:outer membrane protein OmpA-like peptidoglycan-associated protein
MKQILVPAVCLMLAACGGGPRYRDYGPPPPPSSPDYGQMQPYSEKPTAPARPEGYQPGKPQPVASAGPVKTAMIGSYMDDQEQELRRTVHGMPVLVGRPGDDIVIHLRSDDFFEPGSLNLSDNGLRILAAIAPVLRRYDHTMIFIDGYTDTTGSAEQNLTVSRKRAYTIGGALVKDGVPLSRLQANGYGETNPKIKTGDHVNESRNRRIEIRISAKATG